MAITTNTAPRIDYSYQMAWHHHQQVNLVSLLEAAGFDVPKGTSLVVTLDSKKGEMVATLTETLEAEDGDDSIL
ncbi:MAG: hypothetical protein AAF628_35170 [Planctomycetota bacterium]